MTLVYRVGAPSGYLKSFLLSFLFFLFFSFCFFSILRFLFCLSLSRGPFSSGAPGHCPTMPSSRYATVGASKTHTMRMSHSFVLELDQMDLYLNHARPCSQYSVRMLRLISNKRFLRNYIGPNVWNSACMLWLVHFFRWVQFGTPKGGTQEGTWPLAYLATPLLHALEEFSRPKTDFNEVDLQDSLS